MLKACPWCGRIHDSREDCGRRPPKKYRREESERGRNTRAWKRKAEQIKTDSHYLCENCLSQGVLTWDGLEALIYYWTMITSCVCVKNATKKQMPAQYPLIFCDSLRKNETISPRTRRIFERERLYTNRGPRRKNNSQNKFSKGVRTNEPTK